MAVSAEWLQNQLRKPNSMDFLLILDCRLQSDFIESHIKVIIFLFFWTKKKSWRWRWLWILRKRRGNQKKSILHFIRITHAMNWIIILRIFFSRVCLQGSLNFFLPSIILRRLHQKKLDLFSTIKCRTLKNRIMSNYTSSKDGNFTFVLYNNVNGCGTTNTHCGSSGSGCDASSTNNTEINSYNVLKKILKEDGCTLVTLEGKCVCVCICMTTYRDVAYVHTSILCFFLLPISYNRRSRPHACIFCAWYVYEIFLNTVSRGKYIFRWISTIFRNISRMVWKWGVTRNRLQSHRTIDGIKVNDT